MRNTWSCPADQRGAHCGDHPLSARARPADPGSAPRPARSEGLFFNTSPCPPPPGPRPPQSPPAGPPATPRCGAHPAAAGRAAPAPLTPASVRSWRPAALRGARAPGSAPAAAGARPPPGAGPAAAAVRTPAARRHRQQLPPPCPSSYFSDGSSRCRLGKRSPPFARNRLPTSHRSAQTGRKSNAYFFWWTANAIDTELPFKGGEIVLQALGSGSGVGAQLQPPP